MTAAPLDEPQRETGGGLDVVFGRRAWTFRRRLAGSAIAATVVLVGLGSFFAWRQYDDAKDKALADMRARVVLASTVFDTYFAGQLATLTSIAGAPSVVSMDRPKMASYFERLQKQGAQPLFTGGIGWIDREGNARVSDRYPRGSGSNVSDRAYFKRVIATGKPYISQGLLTKVGQRRVVIMAVPTRGANGAISGVLIGALQLRQSRSSQRANDLGFQDLVVLDRAGQQLTLASFAKPENAALLARIRKGDGVLGDTGGLDGDGGRVVAFANAAAPGWTIAFDRSRSAVLADARRSLLIEMISIVAAAAIVLAIVGWAIVRSRREIAAEQEQVRRWDDLAQSLGEASAAAEVSNALGASLATALPRAHVLVALQDDETHRFAVWTYGGGSPGPIDRRLPGLAEIARLGYLSRSPLRITQPAAVGTILSQVQGTISPAPTSIYALPMYSAGGSTLG